MKVVNTTIGLFVNQNYIKKLDLQIEKVYDQTKMNKELFDLKKYQSKFLSDIESRIECSKLSNIDSGKQKEAYLNTMKARSKRSRASLLQMGSLCGKEKVDNDVLVKCGLSIEMLHNMKLILDDYFDNDLMRRGKLTFHTKYDERMLLNTSELLLKLSNNVLVDGVHNLPKEQQKKVFGLYKQIITDIGTGVIEDLDRKDPKIELEDAHRINDLQSTTTLRNALLMGYTLRSDVDSYDSTYRHLSIIGNTIGKVYQGFNDIEDFLSEEFQIHNKGGLYTDLKNNRKNIILGQVPREYYLSSYAMKDIISYIEENHLIERTTGELIFEVEDAKKHIQKLPNPVVRDTLLSETDRFTEKNLRKIKKNKI